MGACILLFDRIKRTDSAHACNAHHDLYACLFITSASTWLARFCWLHRHQARSLARCGPSFFSAPNPLGQVPFLRLSVLGVVWMSPLDSGEEYQTKKCLVI